MWPVSARVAVGVAESGLTDTLCVSRRTVRVAVWELDSWDGDRVP